MTQTVNNGLLSVEGGTLGFRNKIINGTFDIWQRGTSISSTSGTYTADMWYGYSVSAFTVSRNAFTVGQTSVPYNPTYYLTIGSGAASKSISQRIAQVSTLSGSTATVSFYAKSDSATTFSVSLNQYYGSTGSTAVYNIGDTTVNLNTSWQLFTVTFSVPSISGKTVSGGDDHLSLTFGGLTSIPAARIIDLALVQLEAGQAATPFETRPSSIEKLLCGIPNSSSSIGSDSNPYLQAAGSFNFRNKIIGGDFATNPWQRGSSIAVAADTKVYTADRWFAYRYSSANNTVSVVAGSRKKYALKYQRNAGDATVGLGAYICQAIESKNVWGMHDEYVTVSFWVKVGANFSGTILQAVLVSGTGIDQEAATGIIGGAYTGFATVGSVNIPNTTTTLTKFTFTSFVPLSSAVNELGLRFGYTPSGTAGADDSFTLEDVQVESGTVATPFERRPYGVELALCQRYYYRIAPGNNGVGIANGMVWTSSTAFGGTHFPVPMRIPPSALEQSGSGSHYAAVVAGSTVVCNAIPGFNVATQHFASTTFNFASVLTPGHACQIRTDATNGNAAYLGWSAEL
jgi:hypothetical protein